MRLLKNNNQEIAEKSSSNIVIQTAETVEFSDISPDNMAVLSKNNKTDNYLRQCITAEILEMLSHGVQIHIYIMVLANSNKLLIIFVRYFCIVTQSDYLSTYRKNPLS